MNTEAFFVAHRVVSLGGVRPAAAALGLPVSSVSAAMNRLQSRIATPLVAASGNRLLPTLEGGRLSGTLGRLAELHLAVSALAEGRGAARPRGPAVSVAMLQRFVAVARRGSIRGAAAEIGIGQPQLTRQIRHLEAGMGAELLERRRNGVAPTPLGLSLLALAEELDAAWTELTAGASARFRRGRATTRLGAVSPLGFESRIARMLALLVARWPEHRPAAPLSVGAGTAEELIAGLRNGEVDLAILDTPTVPEGLAGTVVSRSPLALVSSFAVRERHGSAIADLLLRAPLAAPSLRSGLRQAIGRLIEAELPEAARSRVSIAEVDMIPVIASLIERHGYVSVLPRSALDGLDHRLASTDLGAGYDLALSLVQGPSGSAGAAMRTALAILAAGGFREATADGGRV